MARSARIWRLLGEGRSLVEVGDQMLAELEVSRELFEADAPNRVADLKSPDVVTVARAHKKGAGLASVNALAVRH